MYSGRYISLFMYRRGTVTTLRFHESDKGTNRHLNYNKNKELKLIQISNSIHLVRLSTLTN